MNDGTQLQWLQGRRDVRNVASLQRMPNCSNRRSRPILHTDSATSDELKHLFDIRYDIDTSVWVTRFRFWHLLVLFSFQINSKLHCSTSLYKACKYCTAIMSRIRYKCSTKVVRGYNIYEIFNISKIIKNIYNYSISKYFGLLMSSFVVPLSQRTHL